MPDVSASAIDVLVARIKPVDDFAADQARERHARLAKPAGSLGELEVVGARLAAIAGADPPPIPTHPALVVAAGDHGVHAEYVTPWPQSITTAVAGLILDGRAASAVLARQIEASVTVIDAGMVGDLPDQPGLKQAKARRGTRNLRQENAMSRDEAVSSIHAGAEVVDLNVDHGCDLVITGDMGIANTTASACLIAALARVAPDEATGRGTGIDDEMLAHKRKVVSDALARHGSDREPLGVLTSLGGYEHAALVGCMLAGAARRVPVLLDGVIANAAALVAVALAPDAADYLIAGHCSTEPGAELALDRLGLTPLLDLGLRLGEGTGALLAVPLVQAAARLLGEMATIEDVLGGDPDA